jgi:hypothetical protein
MLCLCLPRHPFHKCKFQAQFACSSIEEYEGGILDTQLDLVISVYEIKFNCSENIKSKAAPLTYRGCL